MTTARCGCRRRRSRRRPTDRAQTTFGSIGHVPDSDLVGLYQRALCVVAPAYREDYGLTALEAMVHGKPVIACRDGGGLLGAVHDGENGLVVEPTAAALADAVRRLRTDPALRRHLSDGRGRRPRRTRGSGRWPSCPSGSSRRGREDRAAAGDAGRGSPGGRWVPMSWRRARRKVVVVTTFVVHPAAHRGQHRWWALAKQLRRDCDVELLCLGSPTDVASSAAVADGVRQTVAPRTPVHRAIEAQLDLAAGAPIGELLAGVLAEYSPDFEAAAIGSLQDADLAVVAEPSLVEVVHRITSGAARRLRRPRPSTGAAVDPRRGRAGRDGGPTARVQRRRRAARNAGGGRAHRPLVGRRRAPVDGRRRALDVLRGRARWRRRRRDAVRCR